ncbi:hypothetical protein BK659_26000 [Pseudomonas brassicacearum]|uniref:DUF1120 domain-containing protein n=1 Tax=Pseudomonas brassicacearum TaxID=930166 RepID=A0A423GWG2_9PSED|nr:DUF1120 domain-containing protein [Pseudomonas brassicacearum]RON01965.1 hypothetical protein BK659_26000 [Pseudomonas brassicacearum]
MNKPLSILCTALLLTGASSVFASSTDLTVTGTITPVACTPSLSAGGVVDHGKISAKDLNPTNPTSLPRQTLQLAVNCDAATLFALSPIDNRAGTSIQSDLFGLGLTTVGEKLGVFEVTPLNVKADGLDAQPIASRDGGKTWHRYGGAGEFWSLETIWGTGAVGNPNALIPVKDLALDLQVNTQITRARELTLTDEQQIDGNATLEMKYL